MILKLLDPRRRLDYSVAAAAGALPIVAALATGVAGNYTKGDVVVYGFLSKINWILLSLFPAILLFALRRLAYRIAPVIDEKPAADLPKIVTLVDTAKGREAAYALLRRAILSPRLALTAAGISAAIDLADVAPVLYLYWKRLSGADLSADLPLAYGSDWTTMFLDGVTGPWQNLLVVVLAYSLQFWAVFAGVYFALLCLRHNIVFLDLIYQRRVHTGKRAERIVIDLDDPERCFGFRRANQPLNTQISCVAIGALFMIASRFVNVWFPAGSHPDPLVSSWKQLFSLGGQIAMPAGLAAGMLILSLPAAIKLLPRIPRKHALTPEATVTAYLREFLPDSLWPYGEQPSAQEIDYVAAKFASNAFWPTGDNRATWLFFWAFFFLMVVAFPVVNPAHGLYFAGYLAAMGMLAWLLTAVSLRLFRMLLATVDERLVRPPSVPVDPPEKAALTRRGGRIRCGVFISYRRADSSAYAGRLEEDLSAHLHASGDIFMDITDIAAGTNFVTAIHEALSRSKIALILIGRHWISAENDAGVPRLHDPDDLVRTEVRLALEKGLKVIPVLLGGTPMPSAKDLPEDLKPLAFLNALEISDTRWSYDVERLTDAVSLEIKTPGATKVAGSGK